MRIPYVVRGEARPQSWIIMIYGLAVRVGEMREEGKRRSFWMTSSWQNSKTREYKYSSCKNVSPPRQNNVLNLLSHSNHSLHPPSTDVAALCYALLHRGSRTVTSAHLRCPLMLRRFCPVPSTPSFFPFFFCIDLLTALK